MAKRICVDDRVALPPADIEDGEGPQGVVRYIEEGYAAVWLDAGKLVVAGVCDLDLIPHP